MSSLWAPKNVPETFSFRDGRAARARPGDPRLKLKDSETFLGTRKLDIFRGASFIPSLDLFFEFLVAA
jgi:hypothetical protein